MKRHYVLTPLPAVTRHAFSVGGRERANDILLKIVRKYHCRGNIRRHKESALFDSGLWTVTVYLTMEQYTEVINQFNISRRSFVIAGGELDEY